MLILLSKGGPLVWILLASSCIAFGVFLERFFHYHRSSVNVLEFLQGLSNLVKKRNYPEALQECASTPGPVARVLHAILLRYDAPSEQLRRIAREAGQLEVPRIERYLPVLQGVALVTPLIGLLGTVTGMVETFSSISGVSGYATPADVSKGIYQSLITSALGMAVAIPVYVCFTYLSSRAKSLMHDIERASIELIHFIEDTRLQQRRLRRLAFEESRKAKLNVKSEGDNAASKEKEVSGEGEPISSRESSQDSTLKEVAS